MDRPELLTPHKAPPARVLQQLDDLDLALYRKAASAHVPVLDAVLPRLTRSADHGVLWLAVAGVLAATGGRRRAAAVRGLGSLGLASLLANVPAKLSARRARPELHPVPLVRHLRRQPTTTSFPSGHSASAAAFAVGVAVEQPQLAVPIGLLAAGVAYGRVHTGVHYPGDVAAGVLLGAGAASAVRRVWPVRPVRPAVAPPAVLPLPRLPRGAGLVLVLNTSAGGGEHVTRLEEEVQELLPEAELVLTEGAGVEEALRDAAGRARALGVAGGDGTVSTAAAVALAAGLPLAVVPGGTLNHFAAELGVHSLDDLVRALDEGSGVRVTVGSTEPEGDGGLFLNTFALGVYPDLVAERERLEGRIGKWPAMLVAVARTLPGARPVRVEVDGQDRRLWTLFAGNGHYHPAGFAPSWRERLDDGCIDVRIVGAEQPFARTRLVLALLSGSLGRSRVHEQRVVAKLPVSARSPLRVARDGEVTAQQEPRLVLRAAREPLLVYRPRES